MIIKDLKHLEQLIKLCRKSGIEAFECGPIKFNLGPEPAKQKRYKHAKPEKPNDPLAPGGITDRIQVPLPNVPRFEPQAPNDVPTEEDMLFYSVNEVQ